MGEKVNHFLEKEEAEGIKKTPKKADRLATITAAVVLSLMGGTAVKAQDTTPADSENPFGAEENPFGTAEVPVEGEFRAYMAAFEAETDQIKAGTAVKEAEIAIISKKIEADRAEIKKLKEKNEMLMAELRASLGVKK